ncbi:hypothetical protein TRIP_B100010 [uncultured Desulfatiglans sp.]|nr:hypothetical protein TRIP_B100010 [uncultured Desulfatiglans sp.]
MAATPCRRVAEGYLRQTRDMACDNRAMAYQVDGDIHKRWYRVANKMNCGVCARKTPASRNC